MCANSLRGVIRGPSSRATDGVRAYSGQGTRISSPAIVKAALSILVIEARHASRFRAINGNKFAPSAFGAADSMTQVLKTVKGTGFIKS
jgi:hypothetical protein